MLGVDRVGLARLTSLAFPRWTADFPDVVAMPAQETRQSQTVGAGSLDPKGNKPSWRMHPGQAEREQHLEAGRGRRDHQVRETASETVE